VLGILSDMQAERVESYDQYAQLAMDVTVHEFDSGSSLPAWGGDAGNEDDPNHYGSVVTFVFFRHVLFTFHRRALRVIRQSMAEYEHLFATGTGNKEGGGEDDDSSNVGPVGPHPHDTHAPPSPAVFLHDILRHFIVACEASMEKAADEVGQLQEQALEVPQGERTDMLRRINLVRQDLIVLQRRLLRKRLILRDALTGRSAAFVAAEAQGLVQRAAEEIDELAGDLVGLKDDLITVQSNYLSKISIDMAATAQVSSESVKVFAIATTLAIPVTGIGGILGMNVYFPSTHQRGESLGGASGVLWASGAPGSCACERCVLASC
jgi:Mg2+ and Co2+ transporter CorA